MLGGTRNNGRHQIVIELSGNENDVNLQSKLTTLLGSAPNFAFTCRVNIAAGVTIGASTTGDYALDCRSLPTGSDVVITMGASSYIAGAGGAGGNNNNGTGGAGGPGLITDVQTKITGSGTIAGGGGGGGGGRNPSIVYDRRTFNASNSCSQTSYTPGFTNSGTGGGGGGGAGSTPGAGGSGYSSGGSAGSFATGGSGGTTQSTGSLLPADTPCVEPLQNGTTYTLTSSTAGGTGGAGGDLGQAGSSATSGTGGAAGVAITGYSYCTIDGVTLAGSGLTTG